MKNDKSNPAFVLYNKYVRKYKRVYGVKNTMYDDDLLKLGKKLFGSRFQGVYSVDTVPKMKTGGMAIVNVSKSTSKDGGSHWCSLYKKGKTIYIYDSYGRDSRSLLPSLVKKLKGNGMKFADSDRMDKEQSETARNCGIRTLGFLSVIKDLGIKQAMKI